MHSVMEKAGCAALLVVLITSAFLLVFSFYVVEVRKDKHVLQHPVRISVSLAALSALPPLIFATPPLCTHNKSLWSSLSSSPSLIVAAQQPWHRLQ